MAIVNGSGAPDTGDRIALFHELRGLIVAVRELAEAMSLGHDQMWCWHLLNRAWQQLQQGVYLFIDEHRAELEAAGVPLDGLEHLLEPINRALWREYHPEEFVSIISASPLQVRLSVACDKLDMYLSEVDPPTPVASHSPDFRSVWWRDQRFTFTSQQAQVVKLLWEAGEKGMTLDAIFVEIDSSSGNFKLLHVFRKDNSKHPAWGTMIEGNGKGHYWLRKQ